MSVCTFLVLLVTVLIIGETGRRLLLNRLWTMYTEIQNQNNRSQARRFADRMSASIKKGISVEKVLAQTQESLSQTIYDETGFVCVIGKDGRIKGHPDPRAIGMDMSRQVFLDRQQGDKRTLGTELPKGIALSGILPDMEMMAKTHLVYQLPVPGTDVFVSVHANMDLLEQRLAQFEDALLAYFWPIGLLVVMVGTFAVRSIGRLYERRIEGLNASLEQRVKERTEELFLAIEELQATRNKLLQNEKMSLAGQLVAGITHDLNNPLMSVKGFVDMMLLKKDDLSEKQRGYVQEIVQSVQHCINLIQTMLSYIRHKAPEVRPSSVDAILDDVNGLIGTQMRQSKVQFSIEKEEDLPPVTVDRIQIEQVLLNLLNNARQAILATGESGRVLLSAKTGNEQLVITVDDDGPGIPDDIKSHLFEPFYTTKPEGAGTGLGLSLCKHFVEAHRGSIDAVDKPDSGTRFVIRLPIDYRG